MAISLGMLWYDPSTARTLPEKVERAADFYKNKYGVAPNVCFVHPSVLGECDEKDVREIAIRSSRTVLVDHFWLGVEVVAQPLKAPTTHKARRHK